jgi:hypothetical protein
MRVFGDKGVEQMNIPRLVGALTCLGLSSLVPAVGADNGPVQIRFTSALADTDDGGVEAPAAAPGSKEYLLQQLDKGFPLPGARRQTKQIFLSAVMGTPGRGERTWKKYKAREILGAPNERIVVEAAFPNQDPKGKPIVVKGFLQPDS